MPIVVLKLFARAAELAGSQEARLELPSGATVADVRTSLGLAFPKLVPLLERSAVAVNLDFAENDRVLEESDEVAVIPPVSGG